MPIVQLLTAATATNGVPAAVRATCAITTDTKANLAAGDKFVLIDAEGGACSFVFSKAAGDYTDTGVGGPREKVDISSAVSADDVRDAIITAVNASAYVLITASSGGAGTVTLTQDRYGTAGNTTTSKTSSSGTFAITSFTSGALAGVDIRSLHYDRAMARPLDKMGIIVRSTAGSAVMTVTLKLWGFRMDVGAWVPVGSSTTDANRGLLNAATAIGELAAPGDTLAYSDMVDGLYIFDRAYLEITAIGGTSTAVSAWLVRP